MKFSNFRIDFPSDINWRLNAKWKFLSIFLEGNSRCWDLFIFNSMYKMLINAFGIDPEYGHAPECQRLKRQQHLLRNLLPSAGSLSNPTTQSFPPPYVDICFVVVRWLMMRSEINVVAAALCCHTKLQLLRIVMPPPPSVPPPLAFACRLSMVVPWSVKQMAGEIRNVPRVVCVTFGPINIQI